MLDMWIIALITFCVLLIENVSTLVQAIVKDDGYFLFILIFSLSLIILLNILPLLEDKAQKNFEKSFSKFLAGFKEYEKIKEKYEKKTKPQ